MRSLLTSGCCLAVGVLVSCDKGLEPAPAEPAIAPGSFSGLLTFVNWQAVDSLYDIRLVAFTVFPPPDIIDEVLASRAIVYPPLVTGGALTTRGTDSLFYTVPAGAKPYPYVVIALQTGPDLFNDWIPVGQYDLDTNLTVPSPVVVHPGEDTPDINILVDFENPPPFP
jgi:hypothetical protein